MNENDAMALLAKANPVGADDLTPLDVPDRFPRRVSSRRLGVAFAVVAVIAAALAGLFVFNGHNSGRAAGTNAFNPQGAQGATGCVGPTGPGALACYVPISLADASAALGAPVVLPDTPLIGPSDVGSVTKNCPGPWGKTCEITIKFLATGTVGTTGATGPSDSGDPVGYRVQIRYSLGGYSNPLAEYQASVGQRGSVVYLSGIPALLLPQDPNDTVGTAAYIEFQLNGLTISVVERDPHGPTARSIAQSIVDRSK